MLITTIKVKSWGHVDYIKEIEDDINKMVSNQEIKEIISISHTANNNNTYSAILIYKG